MKKIEMIVEIPKGSSNKYEFDGYKMQWKLDRVLYGAMSYPEEYGYIPNTLDYDGDPLDIICLNTFPTFPSCVIVVRILGVLKMIDQGEFDHKLIAVNESDPRFSHIHQLEEIGSGKMNEISNFFSRYKEIENKKVVIEGYGSKEEALKILEECKDLFNQRLSAFGDKFNEEQTSEFLKNKQKQIF